MNNKFYALALAISAHCIAAHLTPEQNAKRLAQVDRNSDGQLQRNEVLLGLLNAHKEGAIDFSLPLDPEAMPHVLQRMPKHEREYFEILVHNFDTSPLRKGKQAPYSFNDVAADTDFLLPEPPKPQPDPDSVPPAGYLLRRNLEKMPVGLGAKDTTRGEMKKADKLATSGAMFSHGWASGGERQILAEGLLAYEAPFIDRWEDGSVGRWLFSLGFHRVDFVGEGKPSAASPRFSDETSLLAPAITFENTLHWPMDAGFTGSLFRASMLGATDWDLESKIPTLELELSFLKGRWGLGSFTNLTGNLSWRADFALHADVGHVARDGKWTKHKEGSTFAHAGPKVSVKLLPWPKSQFTERTPLVLDLGWGQYEKLTKKSKIVRNAWAELSWFLRRPGNGPFNPGVAFTISYKNLKNVENKKDDDSVSTGFAVGF